MSSTPKPQYPQINGGDSQTPFEGLDAEKVAVHLGYTQGAVSKWVKRAKETRDYGYHPIPTKSSRPHSHPKVLEPEIVEAIIARRKKHNRCAEVIHQELANKNVVVTLPSAKRTKVTSSIRKSAWRVPKILLSGNHKKIAEWRLRQWQEG